MNAKEIYEKFKDTVEPLSDEELDYIIKHFTDLADKLSLGPHFAFARNEVIQCLNTFERWNSARKSRKS
jgi:hypothetical protein